ncbi:MAG TPA: DNA primase [Kineosporiaceae bacterium]
MRIRREDVEHVREVSRIDEVVAEHVTLKSAGIGALKGLCPFHDEKSPSFNVRPAIGRWHCFGCHLGGDVIDFAQQIDHLTFTEAVERLAARLGYPLRYEDDDGRGPVRREQTGQRQRLVEAHRVAVQYYAEQLAGSPDALAGRHFLAERGFDRDAAAHFDVGFAPRSGEALLRHLRGRAFTEDELIASGLAGRGQRGLYDRFRGRLVWPIRDLAGDVVGFGARRLFDDDRVEAKYLNTPETALYKKSQVLYGLDLAKKEIARARQVVVVEGYTDVMACHLSGVETAVATCGTAFGADHIRIVRRLIGDDGTRAAEVIFTFDGDAAGQKAALRAFDDDQRFVASTSIAIARDGMDPCELRQARGDEAVRELVGSRQPLVDFAVRSALGQLNLRTAEGRVQGLAVAAPLVARIRDVTLRAEYARLLAGWLGLDEEPVRRAVKRSAAAARRPDGAGAPPAGRPELAAPRPRPAVDPRDPVVRIEREAVECLLQVPHLVPAEDADALGAGAFDVPAYRAVHQAIRAAGGMAAARAMSPAGWAAAVQDAAPEAVRSMISELAVVPLPADTDELLARYAASVVLRVAEAELARVIGDVKSRLARLDPSSQEAVETYGELLATESRRRALRDRMTGG